MTYRWLQQLLGETSPQVFFDETFGNKWLHRGAGTAPDPLAGLVTLRDLELLLFDGNRRDKLFHAVGGQGKVGEEDAPNHHCSADEAVDEWASGKTLIFNGIDRQLPAVHELARGLEGELKCRVWCNLYLTPAQGHGFETHYDPHDVFVLQLIGTKRWRVGASAADAPMPFQVHEKFPAGVEDKYSHLVMHAGDVLYIPRGQLHDAAAQDDLSCHLTIGIHPKTYLDAILTAVTIAADRDPRFRRNLPLGTFALDRDVVGEARRLMDMISDENFREVGDAFCELLASQRRRSPIDVLGLHGKAGQLSDGDRYRAVPYLMSTLSREGEAVELHAMGKSMSFPLSAARDVELCCSGKVFRLADLRGQPESASGLVRRLLFEGIVERLAPGADQGPGTVDLIKHSLS